MSLCESQEIQDLKCSDEHFAVDDGFMYIASLKFFISHYLLIKNSFVFPLDLSPSSPSFPLGPEVNASTSSQLHGSSGKWTFLSPTSWSVSSVPVLEHDHFLYTVLIYIVYSYPIPDCMLLEVVSHLYRAILCLVWWPPDCIYKIVVSMYIIMNLLFYLSWKYGNIWCSK